MQHNNYSNQQQFPQYFQPPQMIPNFQQNGNIYQNQVSNSGFPIDANQSNYHPNDYNYHHRFMNLPTYGSRNDQNTQMAPTYPNPPPYYQSSMNQQYYSYQPPQFHPPTAPYSSSKPQDSPFSNSNQQNQPNPLIIQNNPPRLYIPQTAVQQTQPPPAQPPPQSQPSNQTESQQPKQSKSSKRHKKQSLLNAKKLQDPNSIDRVSPNALAERQCESWGWSMPDFDRTDVSSKSINLKTQYYINKNKAHNTNFDDSESTKQHEGHFLHSPKFKSQQNKEEQKSRFSENITNQQDLDSSEQQEEEPKSKSGGFLTSELFNSSEQKSKSGGFLTSELFNSSEQQEEPKSKSGGFLTRQLFNSSDEQQEEESKSKSGGFLTSELFNSSEQQEEEPKSKSGGFLSDPRNFDSSNQEEINENSYSTESSEEDEPVYDDEYYEHHQIKRILHIWDTLFP